MMPVMNIIGIMDFKHSTFILVRNNKYIKAILQLGYQIWPQAITLFVIYIQYITYYPTETLEYLAMCLTIFLVFIGLVVMKYSNEKIKRL